MMLESVLGISQLSGQPKHVVGINNSPLERTFPKLNHFSATNVNVLTSPSRQRENCGVWSSPCAESPAGRS